MLLTGCGQVIKEVTDQNVAEEQSFARVVQMNGSPEKCFSWMQSNIQYKPDAGPEDEFRNPETTFQLGYGDCDDYALFAEYVLKNHGYDCETVSVFNSTEGHAVCVWKGSDGKYNYLSNKGVRNISADDLNQVSKDIYPDWGVYAIYPSNQGCLRPAGT
jgi:predicted transglutaminase-like cysteine proteinase